MNGYLEALAHWMDDILERRRMGEGTNPPVYNGSSVFIHPGPPDLIIEVRAYSPDGDWRGGVWQSMPREEAVKMAKAILEWAEEDME